MNNEVILENWNSYDKCPDFTPLLTSLLAYKTKLESSLQEKEQEIKNLKLSNKAMILTMDQYEKEIELLKSKLPDQEKLREAIKELEYLNGTLINASEIMKDEDLLDDEELESESDNIKDS